MYDLSFMYKMGFPCQNMSYIRKGENSTNLVSLLYHLFENQPKTNLMINYFLYVFLLRALCRKFRQHLVKIKLNNSDIPILG